jgi:hypothetical protein
MADVDRGGHGLGDVHDVTNRGLFAFRWSASDVVDKIHLPVLMHAEAVLVLRMNEREFFCPDEFMESDWEVLAIQRE